MYLKRLQTVGFKSFAERIDVQFNPGVTAVVGPNGSGKSNIIDAVRWVLGEQSARSLRGKRMEDIIFQGSDTRNPMNFAEVTLILDNALQTLPLDYEEVSVTRRVYRSGESEFFINKQPCRLKDIIDLFMDSGLGKEAFSIISQGKVEEILSSKAEERRVIFEEAAGVLKYKQRKLEAESKLSDTEENLNRVEDIIFEVEQHIEPLNEQANKAKKYRELSNELKQVEVRLLVTEISELHEDWQHSLQKIEKQRLKEIKIKTNIQEREAKLTETRHQLLELDEKLNILQNNLLKATEHLEKYEGEKNVLDERLKHFEENKKKLDNEQQIVQTNQMKIMNDLEIEQTRLQTLQKNRKEIIKEIEQLKQTLFHESENLHAKIEDLKSDYIELLNDRAVTQNERQTVKQELKKLDVRHIEHEELRSNLIQKRNQAGNDEKQLEAKIKESAERLRQIKQRENQLANEIEKLSEQLNRIISTRYKEIEEMTKLTSRKETLEEMKDSYQGYFHGVRALLNQQKNNHTFNIHGTVFDLIEVPQTYVTAIDTILGAQAQHIVVQTEKDARDAISWLKENNQGRATFLPINVIRDRSLPQHIIEKIKSVDGFVGIASQKIHLDESFQIVANHLLGNVMIAKTLRAANTIAQLTNRSYRIVTLDGDVVYPGGSMSGGAKKQTNQSLFTREKDLQIITKTMIEQGKQINELTAKSDKIKKQIKQLENESKATQRNANEIQDQLDQLKSAYDRLDVETTALDNELKSYDSVIKHDQAEKDSLNQRDYELVDSLSHLEQQLQIVQTKINELTEREASLQNEKVQTEQQLHQKEIALAELDERIKSETEKIDDLSRQLQEIDQHAEALKEQLLDLDQKELIQKQKDITEKKIEENLSIRDVTNNKLQEKRDGRIKINEWIEDEQRDLKEEHKQHGKLMTVIQQEEVKANRLDVALDTRLVQLEKEYVTTYEKASKQYDKVSDVDLAAKEVTELKRQIKRLGTVNLGAIEEYERIVERFTFLTEQQTDLIEAKTTLYSVIKEMDEEMIKRFSTTFAHIQKAFTDVFKELFGGGHAKLTLTDETNLLETGIEIVARPPGKKLRTLDLLSGGEKALTAISLLFAILRVRPVPFVILDEVEAALDEANIVRFAKYLKMYSNDTQFIVITHRKGTMEEADVLYGVTMQESGVSRLVSVRLEDTEELVTAN